MITFGTSGRRLTPSTIADITLPSSFSSLISGPAPAVEEAEVYDDLLTDVTDADEIAAEQANEPDSCEQFDFDFLNVFTEDLEGPSGTQPILESVNEEDEQLDCFIPYPAQHAEVLFDAATPYVSDEDLALRATFAPEALPSQPVRSVGAEERSPTPELLDTSELKQQPTVAAHNFGDAVSGKLDYNFSPIVDHFQETVSAYIPRQGRSLMHPAPMFVEEPATETPVIAETQPADEPAQGNPKPVTADVVPDCLYEYDRVLRRITGASFLPGLRHLTNITARPAFIQYHNNLDGKSEALRVPGENFLLADNDESFSLSIERPSAQSIFELIDELVDDEMLDEADITDASSEVFDIIDGLVDADMFDVDSEDSANIEELPRPGVFFDTSSRTMVTFVALGQVLYPPTSHIVSNFADCDTDDNVSYMSDDDPSHTPLLTNSCVNMGQQRSIVYQDIDDGDFDDIDLSELIDLYPQVERPPTPRPGSFGFDDTRKWALTMPQLASHQSAVRQSYRRPSGRWDRHLSRPRLVATTELLPLFEDCPSVYPSPPSSPDSLDFENEQAFVSSSSVHRGNKASDKMLPIAAAFASDYPPCTQLITTCPSTDDRFTENIWYVSPNLHLTHPSRLSAAALALAPAARFPDTETLEVYEIEIHSMLTIVFDCMNNGRLHELSALSNDLHWALSALAHYPGMAVLGSLGAVVEILVERLVASTISCTSASSF